MASLTNLRANDTPNFVVFLADDLGWGDLACYGISVIQTPNLDQFAEEGVRFTQAYSACGVCSPSRSSIFTGRTPYRNGVWRWIPGNGEVHLRASEITIPELVKSRGHETMHADKWHLNEIEEDWKEQHDLATVNPQKLAEMKAKFLEVWNGIEAEGPSDWWKNEPRQKPQNRDQSCGVRLGETCDS